MFRRLMGLALCAMFVASSASAERPSVPSQELNTIIMHATFRIHGPAKADPKRTSFGTVFVMSVPLPDDPKSGRIVLVTAAHVLDDIQGDTATLLVRRPKVDGSYVAFPFDVPIRSQGSPLYVKHKEADVAAMYAALPDEVPLSGLTAAFLTDDKILEEIEIHPGDEAFVDGFPLAATGPGGFPILRTGHLASYPLIPMKTVKQFHFDLFLYGGNSGRPVYYSFANRAYKGGIHIGVLQGILGLVTQETRSALPEYSDKSLNFGVVVPAVFIKETMDMLPPP